MGKLLTSEVTLYSGQRVFQEALDGYFVDFLPGNNRLVVTFESANGKVERPDGLRDNWGQKFLAGEGFSILAVKPKRVEWYRGADLHAFFRNPEVRTFIESFERALFYGSSMGGYAALAFSGSVNAAHVLAHVPQSTLDPALVPWERRFALGRQSDWSGDFRDAAASMPQAAKVFVTYDPFYGPDAGHFKRIDGPNVIGLKMPFSSHGAADDLKKIGFLKQVVLGAMEGDLADFPRMARNRKSLSTYYLNARKHVGSEEGTARCIQRALELDPDNHGIVFIEFYKEFEAHNYEQCIRIYEGINGRLNLGNQKRLTMLSASVVCYAALGNRRRAIALATKILERTTGDMRFYRNMIRACGELGLFAWAETLAAKAQKFAQAKP